MNKNEKYRDELRSDFEEYMKSTNIKKGQPIYRGRIDLIPLNNNKSMIGFTAPKGTAYAKNKIPKKTRVKNTKKRNRRLDKIILRIAILGMVGIATKSVLSYANLKNEPYKAATNISAQKKGNESNDTVEDNIFDYYIQKLQDEDLTEEELRSMPKQIEIVMEYNLKKRLSELLGYPEDEIEFYSMRTKEINGGSTEGVKRTYKVTVGEGRVLDTYESKYQEKDWYS